MLNTYRLCIKPVRFHFHCLKLILVAHAVKVAGRKDDVFFYRFLAIGKPYGFYLLGNLLPGFFQFCLLRRRNDRQLTAAG
jgi:hypothetical protein